MGLAVEIIGITRSIPFCKSFRGAQPPRKLRWTNAGMFGVGDAVWKIRSGRCVSRLMMAAQHVPPEGHDRGVTAGSGVFRMVDGVIRVDERVSNCVDGNRSPWRVQSRDNQLEQEKAAGRTGRLAEKLLRYDLIAIDELGYLPFSQPGASCCST